MLTLTVAERRTWFRASAALMGTTGELLVDGTADHVAAGFRRLRHLEGVWSRFDPGSELNRLHERPGRWTEVSADLLRAMVWCERMHEETNGLFDPSVRSVLESLGYDRTFGEVLNTDSEGTAPRPTSVPGLGGLEIDRDRRRVRLAPGTRLDLGGIGKGLAADIVAAGLVAAGARSAYVSLGGDIHTCGEPPEDGAWPVPLLHPVTGAEFAVHPLANGGLAMSTVALRRWRRGGHQVHHIIDPRTGESCRSNLVAVAVAASSTARAEALAKTALILGSHRGAALLRAAAVQGWLVSDSDVVTVDGRP